MYRVIYNFFFPPPPPPPAVEQINRQALDEAERELARCELLAEHYSWETRKLEARISRLHRVLEV
jgi:hypothetical protein